MIRTGIVQGSRLANLEQSLQTQRAKFDELQIESQYCEEDQRLSYLKAQTAVTRAIQETERQISDLQNQPYRVGLNACLTLFNFTSQSDFVGLQVQNIFFVASAFRSFSSCNLPLLCTAHATGTTNGLVDCGMETK